MNSDGLSALVSQLGCEFDGTFIVTDETPGKCLLILTSEMLERKINQVGVVCTTKSGNE